MIILDSDHLSILRCQSARAERLTECLDQTPIRPIGTSIVNVEEAMRGWLAAIAKERQIDRQLLAYRELGELFAFFSGFTIAFLDSRAIQLFKDFRKSGVKIGTMDLKTACIAIANDALLLTANSRDFEKVPGLRFEN
jgi:tRNA(fMet)-specific endonuclease VapC